MADFRQMMDALSGIGGVGGGPAMMPPQAMSPEDQFAQVIAALQGQSQEGAQRADELQKWKQQTAIARLLARQEENKRLASQSRQRTGMGYNTPMEALDATRGYAEGLRSPEEVLGIGSGGGDRASAMRRAVVARRDPILPDHTAEDYDRLGLKPGDIASQYGRAKIQKSSVAPFQLDGSGRYTDEDRMRFAAQRMDIAKKQTAARNERSARRGAALAESDDPKKRAQGHAILAALAAKNVPVPAVNGGGPPQPPAPGADLSSNVPKFNEKDALRRAESVGMEVWRNTGDWNKGMAAYQSTLDEARAQYKLETDAFMEAAKLDVTRKGMDNSEAARQREHKEAMETRKAEAELAKRIQEYKESRDYPPQFQADIDTAMAYMQSQEPSLVEKGAALLEKTKEAINKWRAEKAASGAATGAAPGAAPVAAGSATPAAGPAAGGKAPATPPSNEPVLSEQDAQLRDLEEARRQAAEEFPDGVEYKDASYGDILWGNRKIRGDSEEERHKKYLKRVQEIFELRSKARYRRERGV